MNLNERITINPEICHGKPTIRGLRYTVETILDLLSSGMTIEEIWLTMKTWNETTSLQHSTVLSIHPVPVSLSSLMRRFRSIFHQLVLHRIHQSAPTGFDDIG